MGRNMNFACCKDASDGRFPMTDKELSERVDALLRDLATGVAEGYLREHLYLIGDARPEYREKIINGLNGESHDREKD